MNKVMCFLTGGHKFKSPAESKCNDKKKDLHHYGNLL